MKTPKISLPLMPFPTDTRIDGAVLRHLQFLVYALVATHPDPETVSKLFMAMADQAQVRKGDHDDASKAVNDAMTAARVQIQSHLVELQQQTT